MRLFERCLRYTSNLFYCSIHVSFFSLARQYDVICFVQALAISNVVEYSRYDLSREFWLNIEFTRKFTSRDFGFYIMPMRSELLGEKIRCDFETTQVEVIWLGAGGPLVFLLVVEC